MSSCSCCSSAKGLASSMCLARVSARWLSHRSRRRCASMSAVGSWWLMQVLDGVGHAPLLVGVHPPPLSLTGLCASHPVWLLLSLGLRCLAGGKEGGSGAEAGPWRVSASLLPVSLLAVRASES